MAGETQRELREGYFKVMQYMNTGTYSGKGDVLEWSYYDSFVIDGTTPILQHRLFTVGLGSLDPVTGVAKNYADTNMRGTQMVPTGSKMYIQAMHLYYRPFETRTEAELILRNNVLADTYMNIDIEGKATYGQWTMQQIMGQQDQLVTVAAAAPGLASTGRYLGVKVLNLPLVIAGQTTLDLSFIHEIAPAADLDGDKYILECSGIRERLS